MSFKTFGEIQDEVLSQTGMDGEPILNGTDDLPTDDVWVHINRAIKYAESRILKIYEDYFLTSAAVTLTQGQSEYALGTIAPGIYANKIRGIIYHRGQIIYEITRLRGPNLFLKIADYLQNGKSMDYRYFLKNTPGASPGSQLVILPAPRETSSTNVTLWYIREAAKFNGDPNAYCDIPEFYSFVVEYAKYLCFDQEKSVFTEEQKQKAQAEEMTMVSTLQNMIADDNDLVEMDLTHYEEHS